MPGLTPIAHGQHQGERLKIGMDMPEDRLGESQLNQLKPYLLYLIDNYGTPEIKSLRDRIQVIQLPDNKAAFTIEAATDNSASQPLDATDYVDHLELLPAEERRLIKIREVCVKYLIEKLVVPQLTEDGASTVNLHVMRFRIPGNYMVAEYVSLGQENNFDAAMQTLSQLYPDVAAASQK